MDAITTITDTHYGRQSGDIVVLAWDVYGTEGMRVAYGEEEVVVVTVLESNGTAAGTRYLVRSIYRGTPPFEVTADHLHNN